MAEQLCTYKKIILKKVTLLPHSRLYSLEPIGVGTPIVESLTSYISRLAYHHSLSVRNLFAFEVVPLLGKHYMLDSEGKPKAGALSFNIFQLRNLNGLGSTAVAGVEAVEKLTLVENLCYLTMLPWHNVLQSRDVLSEHIAWCPFCLSHWRQEGRELYQPLLWSLVAITVCAYHRRKLDTVCPHCSKRINAIQWRTRPGYCSSCLAWLGVSPEGGLCHSPADERDVHVQVAVAKRVGDMLAAAPNLTSWPTKSVFAQALQRCIYHCAGGSVLNFSRFLDMPRTTLKSWRRAAALPRISTLLDICQKIQVPILSLLTDTIEFDCKNKGIASGNTKKGLKSPLDKGAIKVHLEEALHHIPPPSLNSLINGLGTESIKHLFPSLCEEIRKRYIEYKESLKEGGHKLLLEALEEYPPPSMEEVAARSEFVQQIFRTNFPSLCKKISRRYISHSRKARSERRRRVMREIRRVLIDLRQQGIYPSVKNIMEHMSIEVFISTAASTYIINDVRKEFELK